MTLKQIIGTIKNLAKKHPNVNSTYEGNIYDLLNVNPSNKYASVVLTQTTHTQDEMFDHYGFVIFYVDRLVDDLEDNRVQIQSIGKSMLTNIVEAFCYEFDAEHNDITFHPFTQKFADETAGVYIDIVIDTPKDSICAERYWDEQWSAPIITIKNATEQIHITENGHFEVTYDPTNYTGLEKVIIDVEFDTNPYFQEGYDNGYQEGEEQGYNNGYGNGVEEQKNKLESITITENGSYSREDGYNEVIVDVPDLNGSYDDGYNDGYTNGDGDGYNRGYGDGIEEGTSNAGEIIAQTAQVLNITENGTYLTKYSDPIIPEIVTGVYPDGTEFYNYAKLNETAYNTQIIPNENTRVEFWYRYYTNNTNSSTMLSLWGTQQYAKGTRGIFKIVMNKGKFKLEYDSFGFHFDLTPGEFHHIIVSKADGLIVDGEQLTTINKTFNPTIVPIGINCLLDFPDNANNTDGEFGMIKITSDGIENVFIPTAKGFLNTNTGELLEVVKEGEYDYTNNGPTISEGDVTGYFDDGTPFYSYCELINSAYSTGIPARKESRIEFWYKQKGSSNSEQWQTLFGAGNSDGGIDTFDLKYYSNTRDKLEFRVGNEYASFEFDNTVWCHFLIENNTININGQNIASVNPDTFISDNTPFLINSVQGRINGNANGLFGMFKVDDTIFIPTENGWKNYNTGEMLEVVVEGIYDYTVPIIPEPEGNLIKTIYVNVVPKVNVAESGLKFSYSNFTEIPEWADFEGITDMSYMFHYCKQIKTIPLIDTSNVKTFAYAFKDCGITEIPQLNTSNSTDFTYCFCASKITELPQLDLSQGKTFYEFCYQCGNLKYVPNLDLSSATNISGLFENCNALISVGEIIVPNVTGNVTYFLGGSNKNDLTDFGGLIGLRGSITTDGFHTCPNLTYQSCINILNGLYDFTGNGETPSNNQGQLKVHQNFIDTVGDEISIATNKGWQITV